MHKRMMKTFSLQLIKDINEVPEAIRESIRSIMKKSETTSGDLFSILSLLEWDKLKYPFSLGDNKPL